MLNRFQQALSDCQRLYLESAQLCVQQHPHLLQNEPHAFLHMMSDLHRGLLIKTYVAVVTADGRRSAEEQRLAQCLLRHLWGTDLAGDELHQALEHLARQAHQLEWSALFQPFQQIAPLRDRVGELETIVTRLANIIAKADGQMLPVEQQCLQQLQAELDRHLGSLSLDQPGQHAEADRTGAQAIATIKAAGQQQPSPPAEMRRPTLPHARPSSPTLEEVLEQLDQLVGLEPVKQQVRTLINYIRLQHERKARGLAETQLSLHMVFTGNPGTGKTTVARIIGQLYGIIGVLQKGHLVETDRSGLVASYAGQTAPKTNSKIDEALDGVLFIDEAYSLVAENTEDPYGHEALQILLKRIEDHRDRLVVILAGYPQPMQRLLKSNPGLSSRLGTTLGFADYAPRELAQIFQRMCDKNQYVADGMAQAKLMLAFDYLYERRDAHFGNGRLVRNIFEHSIRRLANRIAGIAPLTDDLLTRIRAEDVEVAELPGRELDDPELWPKFRVQCPGCDNDSSLDATILGRRVRCNRCDRRFTAAWGEPDRPFDDGSLS